MGNSNIAIKGVRKYINDIFNHMENDLGLSQVAIENHMFWSVGLDDMFDINVTPELGIGDAKDSLEFVNVAIKGDDSESDASVLMLMHVIPLLWVICERVRTHSPTA